MTKPTLSPKARWWLNRCGFAMMLACAFGITVGTFAPYRFQFGPIRISLRGVRNPTLGLLVGYFLWRLTYDGFGEWLKVRIDRFSGAAGQFGGAAGQFGAPIRRFFARSRNLWTNWGWRQRTMFAILLCQALLVLRFWQNYPVVLDYDRTSQANTIRLASFGPRGHEVSLLEHFCRQVCVATPPGARILFHGGTPAMRFAYEVYPRRVFILPQEMTRMAESWHKQPQLADLAPDAHELYWHQFLPKDSPEPAEFIRQHEINYVATFDEYDLSRCRLEPAP